MISSLTSLTNILEFCPKSESDIRQKTNIPHEKRWFFGGHTHVCYVENAVFCGNFYYEVFWAVLNGGTKNKIVGTEQMD